MSSAPSQGGSCGDSVRERPSGEPAQERPSGESAQPRPCGDACANCGEDLEACACCANCGDRLCASNQRSEVVPICSRPRIRGQSFCLRCKCEMTDCSRGAQKGAIGSQRWCARCAQIPIPKGSYKNKNCVFPYGPNWNTALKLVARWSFLFAWLTPEDLVAILDFIIRICSPARGKTISQVALFAIFWASTIKWPVPVRRFADILTSGAYGPVEGLKGTHC